MQKKATKIFSFFLCAVLLFQQSGFAQVAAELNLSSHFLALQNSFLQPDIFRPLHLRFLGYDTENNNFNLLLDKGDLLKGQLPNDIAAEKKLKDETSELMRYFLIGITLPNESFWVNLRPDAEDNIIDLELARTDIGKVFLEADLQLKKDTASFTSPQTPEGKEYWDRLYKKAEQLYGHENITIPTLTRPWIVPDEIIIREAKDNAYIYKATLKVMLEQDYLKSAVRSQLSATSVDYTFKDERSKALNEYSTQLIRELIIPNLTREVNTSKRYAPLRQVYYSLILAQWFKATHPSASSNKMAKLINSKDLTNFTSKSPWSKATYFNAYKQSFAQGEYNIKEPVYTPTGQVIRSYFSGGIMTRDLAPTFRNSADSSILNKDYLVSMRADSFGNVMAPSVSSSPVAGDHAQPQVTFDNSASPLVLLGSSTDNSEEKNPFFDFKSYSFFDNNFSYSGSKTDYFNLTLKNNPLGMDRLKDNIISQIDAANAKDKKLIYYINAGQDADIGYLLETIAGYIKEKGYSGFELNIMVSTIFSKSVEKAKEVLENCASGYGGLFDLNYAVIRMNNLDKGSVNKFVVLVKSAFGNFDGIM